MLSRWCLVKIVFTLVSKNRWHFLAFPGVYNIHGFIYVLCCIRFKNAKQGRALQVMLSPFFLRAWNFRKFVALEVVNQFKGTLDSVWFLFCFFVFVFLFFCFSVFFFLINMIKMTRRILFILWRCELKPYTRSSLKSSSVTEQNKSAITGHVCPTYQTYHNM